MASTNASNVTGGNAAWLDRWEAFADDASGRLLDRVIGPKPDPVREIEQRGSTNTFVVFLQDNWQAILITVAGGALAIWLAKRFLK